jgi:HrpA-like RNA helicase
MNSRKDKKEVNSLPIHKYKHEIIQKLKANNIILVIGETGSGKTTQMPQIINSFSSEHTICVTQPRRVAAISVSLRVSTEVLLDLF